MQTNFNLNSNCNDCYYNINNNNDTSNPNPVSKKEPFIPDEKLNFSKSLPEPILGHILNYVQSQEKIDKLLKAQLQKENKVINVNEPILPKEEAKRSVCKRWHHVKLKYMDVTSSKNLIKNVCEKGHWTAVHSLLQNKTVFDNKESVNFILKQAKNQKEEDIITEIVLNIPGINISEAFLEASGSGFYKLVEKLLADNRIDLDRYGHQAFARASLGSHFGIMQALLFKENFHPSHKEMQNALETAARKGNVNIITLLLRFDHNFDYSLDRRSAFSTACQNGHIAVVKFLIEHEGIRPQITDLWAACKNNHLEVVKFLLEDDYLRIDRQIAENNPSSPLQQAVLVGAHEIVSYFFEKKFVHFFDCTIGLFHLARLDKFNENHLKTAKILLTHSVRDHSDALVAACEKKHREFAFLLFENGKITSTCLDKKTLTTLFHFSIEAGKTEFMKKLMTEYHVETNEGFWIEFPYNPHVIAKRYIQESQALLIACQSNQLESVKVLLADEKVKSSHSQNHSLREATESHHWEIVRLLLQQKNVDLTLDSNFVLNSACTYGDIATVNVLLKDKRIIPSSQNLKDAAKNNHVEIVKALLIDGRADPVIDWNYPLKLLSIASEKGWLEIVDLLLEDVRINPSRIDEPLSLAIKNGHALIVKRFIEDKRVNSTYIDRHKALSLMVRNGFLNAATIILNTQSFYPYAFKDDLLVAIKRNDTQMVSLLLNFQPRNCINDQRPELLHLKAACENGFKEIVSLLLNGKPYQSLLVSNKLNRIDQKSFIKAINALVRTAAIKGYTDIVLMLFNIGGRPTTKGDFQDQVESGLVTALQPIKDALKKIDQVEDFYFKKERKLKHRKDEIKQWNEAIVQAFKAGFKDTAVLLYEKAKLCGVKYHHDEEVYQLLKPSMKKFEAIKARGIPTELAIIVFRIEEMM